MSSRQRGISPRVGSGFSADNTEPPTGDSLTSNDMSAMLDLRYRDEPMSKMTCVWRRPANAVHVLVVEDPSGANRLETVLVSAGMRVTAVSTALAAVRCMSPHPPDAVLAHDTVSRMDGFELCRYLKRRGELNRCPVIVVADQFDDGVLARAARVHADGVLASSPDANRVVGALFRICSRTRGGNQDHAAACGPARSSRHDAPAWDVRAWQLHRSVQSRTNQRAFQTLLASVREAYEGCPPLALTVEKVQHRWQTSGILAGCVLEELVDVGVLDRLEAGDYKRRDQRL